MNLELYNLILNSILTGIIITTQIVTYPLLKYVNRDFTLFHQKYVSRIGFIVAPIMVLELTVVGKMVIDDFYNPLIKLLAFFTILIWLSTFFIQVPIHKQLSKGKNLTRLKILIASNWIRTIGWSLKLALSATLI
ncbi:MAG: hypothetical protein CMP65_01530 [Flavobacteriales bacterium]|nr:hypothetical protein [Flavobacteriales bacterium]